MNVGSTFRSFTVYIYIVAPLGYSANSLNVQCSRVNEISFRFVIVRCSNTATRLVFGGKYSICRSFLDCFFFFFPDADPRGCYYILLTQSFACPTHATKKTLLTTRNCPVTTPRLFLVSYFQTLGTCICTRS